MGQCNEISVNLMILFKFDIQSESGSHVIKGTAEF